MAKNPWKIATEAEIGDIDSALSDLFDKVTDLFSEWGDKSEKWQDGERGQSVLAWLENTQDAIERAQEAVAELRDATEWDGE